MHAGSIQFQCRGNVELEQCGVRLPGLYFIGTCIREGILHVHEYDAGGIP